MINLRYSEFGPKTSVVWSWKSWKTINNAAVKVVGRRSLLLGIFCIILLDIWWYLDSKLRCYTNIGTYWDWKVVRIAIHVLTTALLDMETESKDHTQWIYGFYQGNSNRFGETMGIGSRHICVNMFLACVFFEVLCFNRCHLSGLCDWNTPFPSTRASWLFHMCPIQIAILAGKSTSLSATPISFSCNYTNIL